MSIRRLTIYAAVLATAVVLAVLSRSYIDALNIHDYSARRQKPRPALLVLDEHQFSKYIEPAFDFRIDRTGDTPDVTFQAGRCLLARRAAEGRTPSVLDQMVTEAVLAMWQEPWMQSFSQERFDEIKRQVEEHPATDQDVIRVRFVKELVAQPEFQDRFRELLVVAANDAKQPIRWETE